MRTLTRKPERLALLLCCILVLAGCRRAAPDLAQRADFQELVGLCLEVTTPLNQSGVAGVIHLSPLWKDDRQDPSRLVPVGSQIWITDFVAVSTFEGMWYKANGKMRIGERDFPVELGRLLDSGWYWAAQQAANDGKAPIGVSRKNPPIDLSLVHLCPGTEAAPMVTPESQSKIQGTKKP